MRNSRGGPCSGETTLKFIASIFRFGQFFSAPPAAFASGWPSDDDRPLALRRHLWLRPDWSLPFYCKPVNLFVISWLLMLGTLVFRVSYDSYPEIGLPILLFVGSMLSLWAGYAWIHSGSETDASASRGVDYVMNVTRLRRLNNILAFIALAIMLVNLKLEGLPPIFGLLSFDTKVYLEYGRLKQLLFPVLITLTVNSFLEPSRGRKVLFCTFGLLAQLFYITRGGILGTLLQIFFVFSMTTRLNRRKLMMAATCVIIGLTIVADVIGNNRTTQECFYAVLQIRQEYRDWPMIFLWVISYFSIPLSNLCWIVHTFHFRSPTIGFIYPALPSFWIPADPHEAFINGNSHIIDNVHTYLAPYFLDFSFAGVLMANFALGAVCAYVMRRGLSRNFLTSAVFLSCVAEIFFNDNFMPLSTLLLLAIQAGVQRYILSLPQERPRSASLGALHA